MSGFACEKGRSRRKITSLRPGRELLRLRELGTQRYLIRPELRQANYPFIVADLWLSWPVGKTPPGVEFDLEAAAFILWLALPEQPGPGTCWKASRVGA